MNSPVYKTIAAAAVSATLLTAVPASVLAAGPQQVYSNFNTDPDNAYDCCLGWAVSSFYHVAMPFTPAKDVKASKITVAASYVVLTNGVEISLHADADGLPGALIRKGLVRQLPDFETCCVTTSVGANRRSGAALKGGTQYWVVLRANHKIAERAQVGWNLNNQGVRGTYAYTDGAGWLLTTDTFGAFSVEGR